MLVLVTARKSVAVSPGWASILLGAQQQRLPHPQLVRRLPLLPLSTLDVTKITATTVL